jgi:hypothetical protein
LFENAKVLQGYIADVKRQTGAEMEELIGHSMGGMISRIHIDQLMGEREDRDISQLFMLGSPNLGSDCANFPIALGWYLSAAPEIRSSYARELLNPQIFHRKGVQFYALAGDPITKPVGSLCTSVPSESVVSLDGATAIHLEVSELPLLHSSLTISDQAFNEFVKPLLEKKAAGFYFFSGSNSAHISYKRSATVF